MEARFTKDDFLPWDERKPFSISEPRSLRKPITLSGPKWKRNLPEHKTSWEAMSPREREEILKTA